MADRRLLYDIPQVALGSAGLAGLGSAIPRLVELYERGERLGRVPILTGQMVLLVGPEMNRRVLTTGRHQFSNHDGWGMIFGEPPNLVTLDGEPHDQQRRSAAPAFQVKRMDGYLPMVDFEIQRRIADWGERDEVDVYEETRELTFDLAARAFLGMEPGEEMDVLREGYLVDLARQRKGARRDAEELLKGKIAVRREGDQDDALALLTRHMNEDGSSLSDAQLIAHARFLLHAGYATSASLGAWSLYMLIVYPDYRDRVMAELAASPLSNPTTYEEIKSLVVIDHLTMETERLYPPVPLGPRGLAEDVELEGYHLPKGTFAAYAIAASHLLPSIWANPTEFDPDRFAAPREEHKKDPYALVGFGGGPRRCLGMTFARAELALLIARVCARYDLETVDGNPVTQSFGIESKPQGGMRLRARPRAAAGPQSRS